MFVCLTCHNPFKKPVKSGAKLGFLWIIAMIFSFGLALLLWLLLRSFRKDVCPFCGSNHFIDEDHYKGGEK